MRILLYRSGALGDTLLTLPALDVLRRRHPAASLTLAAHPAYGAPLQGAGRADALIDAGAPPFHLLHTAPVLHATPEGPRPAPEEDDLGRLLRAFGLIILLIRDPEGAVAARLRSLESGNRRVRTLIVPPFPPEGDRRHIAAWTLATLGGDIPVLPGSSGAPAAKCGEIHAPSCDSATAAPPVAQAEAGPETGPEAAFSGLVPTLDPLIQSQQIQSDADKILNRIDISPASPFIAIHPGGGGRPKWPPAGPLAALARGFVQKTGARPLLIEGPADEVSIAEFRTAWGATAHTGDAGISSGAPGAPTGMAAGGAEEIPRLASPPLDLLSALLARSAAYIGGDSGVTHLAALSGAPTLGLLGPASDPGRWAPIGPRAGWISWERASKGVGLLMRLAGDFS